MGRYPGRLASHTLPELDAAASKLKRLRLGDVKPVGTPDTGETVTATKGGLMITRMSQQKLPLLPTMGVGSYASPGWLVSARKMLRKGELGERDIEELFDDALAVCIGDQLEAGVDILTDGELRRQRFVFELYDALVGLERVPPLRRVGVSGDDMAPHFNRVGGVSAPRGLGVVEDFLALKAKAPPGSVLKVALPGPLTFAAFISAPEDEIADLLAELVVLIKTEIAALIKAGASYVQLDEPGLTNTPFNLTGEQAAAIINRCLPETGCTLAIHVCFGNNAGRPFADRRMDRLIPALEKLACHQLVLEFANREMAEIDILAALSQRFDIAAGVVDVKSFYLESAERVAERIRQCLEVVPLEKLSVTADCGFSALPRYSARDKMRALVAGTRLVRGQLES